MEYLKTGGALFSMKIHFWPIWAKRAQIGPKIIFLNFLSLLKILKSFLGNNLKWKLILLLIFHHQSHIWQNSGSRFMGQNAVNQSSEKHGGWSWFFAPADKRKSFQQIDSITLGVHSQACPKYPKQVYNIFAIKK